ncbi:MAG: B12-binding domain-containing radical SAM protein [Bacteroidetes bacterium]|nr:MAG: B12-binding domain-containing radical SAM protein [Bacteroidota bacterium]
MVLFTHGYFLRQDPKEQAIMRPYPPLGILYLSAWLEQHDVANAVFDSTFSDPETLQQYLLDQHPQIVAIYTNLMTKRNVLSIMRFIRQQPALGDTLIVLGGPDVTYNTAEYLAAGADLIVIGEGEQTMLEVARTALAQPASLTDKMAFQGIPGLAFQLPDGSVHRTAPREKIRDVDTLPFPNRQKIDLEQYLRAWKQAHGLNAISLSTQRGCPYTCRWCSTAVYGQSYRRRSPEKVVDEIEWLQGHYNFDLIWFVDDVFTVSHKWLSAFRDELQRRQVRIRFECISRADRMNPDVIQVLREAGCFRVWIGAESGSQRIIDAMDRRVEVGQVRQMIQATREAGIEAGTFIMLGYPGETEADIRETVHHLKTSDPDLFTITVAYPIKGTGLYEAVRSEIQTDLPWSEHTDRDLDFTRTYPRRYYDYAVRWTVNTVHWHKSRRRGNWWKPGAMAFGAKAVLARVGMWWWRRQAVLSGKLPALR